MELECARVLIVNDDGVDAPGIAILEAAVRRFCDDVWVVAPAENQSSKGRAITQTQPVRAVRLCERRFAVHGTPGDCVLVGLNGLLDERRPDLVLSGVNEGANIGEDIACSGTVGACLWAAEQGVAGIAFSQVCGGFAPDKQPISWACAERELDRLLPRLVAALDGEICTLNVNFPVADSPDELRGVAVTHTGWRSGDPVVPSIPVAKDREFHYPELRPDDADEPDSDIAKVCDGFITVTPLMLDQTCYPAIEALTRRL